MCNMVYLDVFLYFELARQAVTYHYQRLQHTQQEAQLSLRKRVMIRHVHSFVTHHCNTVPLAS